MRSLDLRRRHQHRLPPARLLQLLRPPPRLRPAVPRRLPVPQVLYVRRPPPAAPPRPHPAPSQPERIITHEVRAPETFLPLLLPALT